MYYIIRACVTLLIWILAGLTGLAVLFTLLVVAPQLVPWLVAQGMSAPAASVLAFVGAGVAAGMPGAVLIGLLQRYTDAH